MVFESRENKTILLTFDVEDWFQVENFKEHISYSSWASRELRVEKNTVELLNLLADVPTQVNATFFVLGWIAERCPGLIREIHQRGHEVASHGVNHHLCYNLTPEELRRDLVKSKSILEDILGVEVVGYRAPSFSITDDVLDIVREAGYLYDSSYNSYEGHGRYGALNLLKKEKQDLPIYSVASSFYEIPVTNLRIGSKIIPWGGGGYFRLLPSFLHRAGVKHILKQKGCYTFYMHPWEIDPDQPRVNDAKASFRYRHYVNLSGAKIKLKKLIDRNAGHSFLTCKEFIEKWFSENVA
jgi:polysaccharide deacetylase family protein (PEP-CTERM system associated)